MKIRCVILMIIISFVGYSQGETSNWYFGNGAGLQFNADGTVSSLADGKMNTFEGGATISDVNGELLFYTDGITVYDKDHEVMQNGNDLFGNPSSTQSAIIVPKPGNSDIYYIFTVDSRFTDDENDPTYDGFNYSIVDISLNNGKGAIVEKNIKLLDASSEKITAVLKDCIDQSLWVITLSSENGKETLIELEDGYEFYTIDDYNTFHAFEVNLDGVQTKAIKSTFVHDSIHRITDRRGYLKLSPDGKKLASANQFNGLYLYDFDVDTGIVSREQKIEFQIKQENYFDVDPYGVEFSPNGNYLYTHALTYQYEEALDSTFVNSALLQYDIHRPEISESEHVIEKDRAIFRGALQLGENGKIYRTIAEDYDNGTHFLGVINAPNNQGASCDYLHNAVQLDGLVMQGLPPFIQSFFDKEDLVLLEGGTKTNTLTINIGEAFTLAGAMYDNAQYIWSRDGTILNDAIGNTYQISNATSDASGRYRLEIKFQDPNECPIFGEALIEVIDKFELGFPKYFTPNGDGVNENWHHVDKNTTALKDLSITIYDRYGKLIHQLKSNTIGWDGTHKNRPMPSSDYWYKAVLNNERVFTGHFSLKR